MKQEIKPLSEDEIARIESKFEMHGGHWYCFDTSVSNPLSLQRSLATIRKLQEEKKEMIRIIQNAIPAMNIAVNSCAEKDMEEILRERRSDLLKILGRIVK